MSQLGQASGTTSQPGQASGLAFSRPWLYGQCTKPDSDCIRGSIFPYSLTISPVAVDLFPGFDTYENIAWVYCPWRPFRFIGPFSYGNSDESNYQYQWQGDKFDSTIWSVYGGSSFSLPAEEGLTITFQGTGSYHAAKESGGVITVYDPGGVDATFAGSCPVILYTGPWYSHVLESSTRSTICFYVHDQKLKARSSLDLFASETILWSPGSSFILDDSFIYTENYLELRGIFSTGAGFKLKSLVWPKKQLFVPSEPPISIRSSLVSGVAFYVTVDLGAFTESASLQSAVTTGLYNQIVVALSSSPEFAQLASSLTSGSYVLRIVLLPDSSDGAATLSSTITQGDYVLRVVVLPSVSTDPCSLTSQITGGSYV